ncbi:MAG TPA: glycosyltransferase family 2 protein [Thermoanaerobaculia bacterium]|nr:glycosyltransferase family 2 protein [Thermoanaerobaculia bacterium]
MADVVTAPVRSAAPPVAAAGATTLSIVIVTWNSERWIEPCLQSLPAACDGVPYEIVIYDNASIDGTLRRLPDDSVRVIRSSRNDGFAAGTNRALAQSTGRFVFLLNPDCELEPRALALLVDFLDKHPHAAAAAPLLADAGGGSQREFQLRRLPTLRGLAAEALLVDKIIPKNKATAHYRYADLDLSNPQRIEQPAAAALLVRRSVFDQIGGFDEQFSPAWFEDVDFCRRLAEAKLELFVVPAAKARHAGGASLEHMPYARFIDLWYRNMWRYARKWFSPGQAEALRWAVVVGMMMRCAAAAVGFRNGSSTRWEALRTYARVLQKALNRWDDSSPSSL